MTLNLERLLRALAFDLTTDLWWREVDGELRLFIQCSDFFHWATSDVEPIETDEDIAMLEQAIKDCQVATRERYPDEGPLLYAARHRGMRPQRPYYEHLDTRTHPLFNAAGPLRDRASEG